MAFENSASLVNELEPLIVADLVAANNTNRSPLLPEICFLIDLVANIVAALLHKKQLCAFLQLVHNYLAFLILTVFQAIQKVNHEQTVVVIFERVVREIKLNIFIKIKTSILLLL